MHVQEYECTHTLQLEHRILQSHVSLTVYIRLPYLSEVTVQHLFFMLAFNMAAAELCLLCLSWFECTVDNYFSIGAKIIFHTFLLQVTDVKRSADDNNYSQFSASNHKVKK